ncbi:hypothetical protein MJH12_03210, partial [bacterium]|nr:hypothetical protein [bacterium]
MSQVKTRASASAKATASSKSSAWFQPRFLLMDWFSLSNHLIKESENQEITFKVNPYFQELMAQQSNALEHMDNYQSPNANIEQEDVKEELFEQARLDAHNDESDLKLLTNIIEYLDDKGYMSDQNYSLFCLDFKIKSLLLDRLLSRLQNYEPKGFGTKGLKDFFLFSIENGQEKLKLSEVILNNDFLNIANDIDKIVDKYNYLNQKEVQDEVSLVYHLSDKRQYPAYNLNFSVEYKNTRLADFKVDISEDESFKVHSYLSDLELPDQLESEQIYLKQIEKRIHWGPRLLTQLLDYQKK